MKILGGFPKTSIFTQFGLYSCMLLYATGNVCSWCGLCNKHRAVWMNYGPERAIRQWKKGTGHNISFSTVTSSIFSLPVLKKSSSYMAQTINRPGSTKGYKGLRSKQKIQA